MSHIKHLAEDGASDICCVLVLRDDGAGCVKVGNRYLLGGYYPEPLDFGTWSRYCALRPVWWNPLTWRPVHEAVVKGLARFAAVTKDAKLAREVSEEMGRVAEEIAKTVKEATA